MIASIGVMQTGPNILQIIGFCEEYNEMIKTDLIRRVAELSLLAESKNGVPLYTEKPNVPQYALIVHSTYQFLTGRDMNNFLEKCSN